MAGNGVEFLTVREVAALMRFSVDRIQALCRDGQIVGAMKFGGSWRIHKRSFLESIGCTDEPPAEEPDRLHVVEEAS